ncbi:MAG: ATP-binding protein, partial [Gammaproteobacteria bacterium]
MKPFLSSERLFNNEHRILGLMLFCLLFALFLGSDSNLSRSFLTIHFGLFLLWQPVVSQEKSFSTLNLMFLAGFILVFIVLFNLWLATFWMLLLLSLLTGRIFARGLGRAVYGIAVIVLFLQLTLMVTPEMFRLASLPASIKTSFSMLLMVISLLLVLTPSTTRHTMHVDFIRGFMVVVLTLFLCMGSVLTTYTTQQPYVQSLAGTILVAAAFLFALAILWAPRAGFTGLAQLWEKYLLNIGGPFEQWLAKLSALEANTSIKPDDFLEASIDFLLDRHWIAGIEWETQYNKHHKGEQSNHTVAYADKTLSLKLYAYSPIGPALLLHTKLLLSVITFYYNAKLQEQQLIKQAHLRAIYETGSKLTHDIKNILQSTQTLTQVMQDKQHRTEDVAELLRKQLPLLTQRLKSTLEKLSTPSTTESTSISVHQWWQQFKDRYTGREIAFEDTIEHDCQVPYETFDSILENLLQNAREKRIHEPGITISVSMSCKKSAGASMVSLKVCDSGSAISDEIKQQLFHEPLQSESGFGIGLYQSRQQAE